MGLYTRINGLVRIVGRDLVSCFQRYVGYHHPIGRPIERVRRQAVQLDFVLQFHRLVIL